MPPRTSKPPERIVAIVGRPNVGKSALFNRLVGRRMAIVYDQPGVTRDRLSAHIKGTSFPIAVIDTGGIGASLEDGFAGQVRAEADIAIESADLIILVCDVLAGVHPVDQALAHMLRKQRKPVILGLNKADDPKHDLHEAADFASLGFRDVAAFSANHGRGIDPLIALIEKNLEAPATISESATPEEFAEDPNTIRLAIIGRPNVGKSSLFNAILGENRAIVSDIAGTTRDSIDSLCIRNGKSYLIMDTAGIRRQSKIDGSVEAYSVARAEKSIRRADLCALVFDASRGITAQERKIAGTIVEENKPCIIVANKFDLYHPDGQKKARLEELTEYARRELYFLDYAPLIAVSAKDNQNLGKIFVAVENVRTSSQESLGTGALNRLLQESIDRSRPPHIGGKRLKLLYATLARDVQPRPVAAPRVVLFVNHRKLLSETYLRFLEGEIRSARPYEGLPIHFDVRERQQKGK